MVLVVNVNAWETSTNFLDQSQSEATQSQNNPGFLTKHNTEISLLRNTQNDFTYLEQEDSWITEEGNKGHKDLGVLHKQLPSGLEAGKEWKEIGEDNLTFRFKNDFSAKCRSGVRIFRPLKLVPSYRSPSLSLTSPPPPLHFPRFFLVLLWWLPKTRLWRIWNRGIPKLREGGEG